jgi:hypothetical protein
LTGHCQATAKPDRGGPNGSARESVDVSREEREEPDYLRGASFKLVEARSTANLAGDHDTEKHTQKD